MFFILAIKFFFGGVMTSKILHLKHISLKSFRKKADVSNPESISSTIYEQLLCVQIPKAQKDTDNLTEFLRFWDLRT